MTPNDQATWHVGHNTDAELQELPLSEPALLLIKSVSWLQIRS